MRPKSEVALNTLLQVAGRESLARRPIFRLCWNKDHFGFEPKDFGRTIPNLTEEEMLKQKSF